MDTCQKEIVHYLYSIISTYEQCFSLLPSPYAQINHQVYKCSSTKKKRKSHFIYNLNIITHSHYIKYTQTLCPQIFLLYTRILYTYMCCSAVQAQKLQFILSTHTIIIYQIQQKKAYRDNVSSSYFL